MNRMFFVAVCAVLCAGSFSVQAQAPPAGGEGDAAAAAPQRQGIKAATSAELIRLMSDVMDMKEFQQPLTLKEVLGLFYEKYLVMGKELPILIDQRAFAAVDPDIRDLYEMQVKFPPYPKQMMLGTAFKVALAQMPVDATFLVREGRVLIVPIQEAALKKLAKHPVMGDFRRVPVLAVISDLADQAGLSIVVDNRIDDKANVPITVTFGNNLTVQDALLIVCDMAGFKVVELPSSFYVTTRDNAAALQPAPKSGK